MNRKTAIFAAFVLLITVWLHWNLWKEPPPTPRSPARIVAKEAWPPNPRLPAGSIFTIPATEKTAAVTLDFDKTLRSLRLLHDPDAAVRSQDGGAFVARPDLDFLMWPRRQLMGTETLKMHRCRVIDFYNPGPATDDHPHYLVRLFVRESDSAFMRLNTYNWDGKLTGVYQTKGWRKLDGEMLATRSEARRYEPDTHRVTAETEFNAVIS